MMCRRPYGGKSRKEIRDQILTKQVQIKRNEIPNGWSLESADFVNKLIQRKPINRLGLNGPEEVRNHDWMKDFPFQKLRNKELISPFIPQKIENYFENRHLNSDHLNEEIQKQNNLLLKRTSIQNLFAGYHYDISTPQY